MYDTFRCDQVSFQRLVGLSQFSPAGYREANKLIDKMLVMLHSGKAKELGNPSAYITTGCMNARKLLTPEGEYYKGKGSYK